MDAGFFVLCEQIREKAKVVELLARWDPDASASTAEHPSAMLKVAMGAIYKSAEDVEAEVQP